MVAKPDRDQRARAFKLQDVAAGVRTGNGKGNISGPPTVAGERNQATSGAQPRCRTRSSVQP
jgi:hypothetical protein